MSLTARQARFVEEYLIDLNAKEAAIRAGYSKKVAKQSGYKALQIPAVQEAVTAAMQARSERKGIEADEVLAELRLIGFSNMLDYMTVQADGTAVIDLSGMDREKAVAIQELVVDEYTDGKGNDARPVKKIRFKLADKRGALVDLGRHLGLFTDNLNLGGTLGLRWEETLKDLE